jgi:DNA methyltransferase 1-associated protein 1
MFDANHERKRKEQLTKLYDRTPEQIEEEQTLLDELRKIEARKKEREKKTQDLQKLITAADNNSAARKSETQSSSNRQSRSSSSRKKTSNPQRVQGTKSDATPTPSSANILETAGIKFPEVKSSGATLRSSRMKLPGSVGQKKAKAIEQLLLELNIDLRPMPTEEICQHFNELRSDMVLLYELKMALANCEFELQTLKHQYEALQPGKQLDIPANLLPKTEAVEATKATESGSGSGSGDGTKKPISEVIDVSSGPLTPNRKRRAALEQGNLLKKLKKI